MKGKLIAAAASMALLAGCGMFSHGSSQSAANPGNQPSAAQSRQSTQAKSSPDVAAAQRALKQAGFDPGSADGMMGTRTRQALRDYQQSKGLKVTGNLDDETRQALLAGNSQNNNANQPGNTQQGNTNQGSSQQK